MTVVVRIPEWLWEDDPGVLGEHHLVLAVDATEGDEFASERHILPLSAAEVGLLAEIISKARSVGPAASEIRLVCAEED